MSIHIASRSNEQAKAHGEILGSRVEEKADDWSQRPDGFAGVHTWGKRMSKIMSTRSRLFRDRCDDDIVPVFCPTCQLFRHEMGRKEVGWKTPCASRGILLCMGLFSTFVPAMKENS
jgi:hypothetical protein